MVTSIYKLFSNQFAQYNYIFPSLPQYNKFLVLSAHVTATCGQATAAGGRVIGGKDATAGEWPWQAKLETKNSGFTCGGSLITPEWIMTAAHCISNKDPKTYRVTLGDLNRQKPEVTEQKFTVKRVKVHPDYNSPVPINNDIALLELTRPATITSFVNTVCLPRDSDVVPIGTKCYISGNVKCEVLTYLLLCRY